MTFKPRATLLPDAFSNSVSGTTTDAYVSALDWRSCAGWNSKSLVIANTGDTNSMVYKILLYTKLDSDYYYVYDDNGMEEFTVSDSDSDMVNLNYAYDRVIVQVKSAAAGSATTYEIDAIGNKGGSS